MYSPCAPTTRRRVRWQVVRTPNPSQPYRSSPFQRRRQSARKLKDRVAPRSRHSSRLDQSRAGPVRERCSEAACDWAAAARKQRCSPRAPLRSRPRALLVVTGWRQRSEACLEALDGRSARCGRRGRAIRSIDRVVVSLRSPRSLFASAWRPRSHRLGAGRTRRTAYGRWRLRSTPTRRAGASPSASATRPSRTRTLPRCAGYPSRSLLASCRFAASRDDIGLRLKADTCTGRHHLYWRAAVSRDLR